MTVTTTVDRLLPDEDAEALLGLAHDIYTKECAPQVHDMEERAEFPGPRTACSDAAAC